ncbi:MAG: hypothetical protein ACYDAN_06200 [Candidatus Limnocylindrales bacterium]
MGERRRVRVLGAAVAAGAALAGMVFLGCQESRSLGPAPRMVYDSTSMAGYWDVACATTMPNGDPGGCSTPLPSLDPAAVAAAVPLEVPSLDVPVTKTGPLEIDLGEATLASGVLHEASFHLDGIEPGVQVLPKGLDVSGTIRLVVRSADASRPAMVNGYTHGWHPGVEVVKAYLVLDVTRFDSGTLLKVRDVLVR